MLQRLDAELTRRGDLFRKAGVQDLGAYRGAGRPEATAAMERMIDMYASEIGMDPGDLRRRNVIAPSAFPYATQTGASYDSGEYALALDRALDAAGYAALRGEQAQRRRNGDRMLLGIGMASYVEVTNPMGSGEWASIEVKNRFVATTTTVFRTLMKNAW